jgi:hypothetical protein
MLDVHDIIRDYLLTQSGVTTLVSTRIYAGRDVPPETYALTDGPCITLRVRGGNEDYEGALLTPSVQFKCYGATDYVANSVYRALDDALHGDGLSATLLHGEREVQGQPLEEPQTEWPYTLAFYQVMIRNS